MSDPNGLLDPEQPTKAATDAWRESMMVDFTPVERMQIRISLGMGGGDQ